MRKMNKRRAKKAKTTSSFTAQAFWDLSLTHRGRANVLGLLGRALGFQFEQWADLPDDLKRQLETRWKE
jgi:hypothetical protein